jgi:amino-acid N-acetyltransferase
MQTPEQFVHWFRSAAPYIHAFRGRTFVVAFGGEVVADGKLVSLTHDLNLLASLGVKLVLVHGARPQIEAHLKARQIRPRFVRDVRVTDETALECVKQANGQLRADIEALLSMGLPQSPMANATIHVAGGNFVVARPRGVVDGVDMQYTGEVRRIHSEAIRRRLDAGELVLLSPLGYSPTGEIFNLTMEDLAAESAIGLAADKLIFLIDAPGVKDEHGGLMRELTVSHAQRRLDQGGGLARDVQQHLPAAIRACSGRVPRVHLVSRHVEGALLMELFTHEGVGTMVSRDPLEQLRAAAIDHDRRLVGCGALYPFPEDAAGELACLAVHPDYRNAGAGERLLRRVESEARRQSMSRLFVLTTRATHWFIEHGFAEASVDDLPAGKQALYNYQRRSKVLVKQLEQSATTF